EIGAALFEKAYVGQDNLDARIEFTFRKGDAAVDHQPATRILGSEPVQIGVHADLAEPAKGYKHEFVAARVATGTPLLLPHACGSFAVSETSPNEKLRRPASTVSR